MNHFLHQLRPHTFALVGLILILGVMFHPYFLEGKLLAPLDIKQTLYEPWKAGANGNKPHNHYTADAVTQYLPYRIQAERSFREDGYLGWNPFEMGGHSLASNTMALPGSWSMQLHRWLPFQHAWNIGIYLEFLIAGMGMWLFLKGRKLASIACFIGAVAYMANSQFIIWVYHRWALSSFCWMPWVLWAATNWKGLPDISPKRMFIPIFLSLAFLGASLQHMAFIVISCLMFAIGGLDFSKPRESIRSLVSWGLAGGIAACMVSFTLVPQINAYLENIATGQVRGGIGYLSGPIKPVLNAFAIPLQIWPWLIGSPQSLDGWRIFKMNLMDLAYFGTIPMFLAFFGLFRKEMPRQAKFLVAAGLLIPLTPLVGPLYHRVQLVFILGGCWLAAEMLARLINNPMPYLGRSILVFTVLVFSALIAAELIPHQSRSSYTEKLVEYAQSKASESPFGQDKNWIHDRVQLWANSIGLREPRTLILLCVLFVGATGLILASRDSNKWKNLGNIAITGVTVVELGLFFSMWTTFSQPNKLLEKNEAIESLKIIAGSQRVIHSGRIATSKPSQNVTNIFASPNLLSSYGVPTVDGYESIQSKSIMWENSQKPLDVALTLAGVSTVVLLKTDIVPDSLKNWKIEGSSENHVFRKNPEQPEMVVSGNSPLPQSTEEFLAALKSGVVIPVDSSSMNRMSFKLPVKSDWVRICQNWSSGWKWRIDNSPWQPLDRAQDGSSLLNSQSLDAGKWVSLQYFPCSKWTISLSLISLLLTIVLMLAGIFSRIRQLPAQ